MPDTTNDNDIDALRGYLSLSARTSFNAIPSDVADIYHRALTALVAERDKAKADFSDAWRERCEFARRIDEADGAIFAVVAERDRLKRRVAELEKEQIPSEIDIIQMDLMNRDAELRLACSALTGIYAHLNRVDDPVRNGQSAAAAAKAALDALRPPRTWRTCDAVRELCGDPDSDLDGEALAAMRKGVADAK